MTKKRLVLTFPTKLLDQPVTYHLIKDFDLMVNILRANVTPDEEGRLVIEITGEKPAVDKGMKYLSELGVKLQPVAQEIHWYEDKCDHCTACIPVCPTGALSLDRNSMYISFDNKKCIMCGLCIPVCPYRAMEMLF
ncbi:MAG: NIL domain-containing protein [Candidatus Omnitrophota bacterium]